MRIFTWRKLVILLLLAALCVLWIYRVSIKEFVLDWQKPVLPAAKQYLDVIASPLKGINSAPAERSNPNSAKDDVSSQNDVQRDDKPAPSMPEGIASVTPQDAGLPRNDSNPVPLEYNLAVPFQSQAPYADWGLPYQEACEEASLVMADAFYNKKSLTANEMDERIKQLVAWETKKFGYYEDTTAEEVAVIGREYFGLKAELDYDVSVANIKKYLSQNKLVLVPAAGKVLPNPNFKNGGPLYHMLVIRGYTADKFITNDPGTRKGKEFVYRYDDLLNAVHDWPGVKAAESKPSEADILTGGKVLIVVDK